MVEELGVSPEEAEEALPGDDVIADANAGETRAITVNAPAAAVWPWLVQLGTGRGGWYSYEGMGMQGQSAFKVLPDFQDLKVGDLVPTYPGGGFVVSRLEPGRALVLYLDSNLAREQAAAAKADGAADAPAGKQGRGALMENAPPIEFAATWAFVLDEQPNGQTRLIERFRFRFGETDQPWTRYTLPFMGFGMFVMMRKQLLGIKQRVEAASEPVEVVA